MKKGATDILNRVDAILTEPNGGWVIHDFLDKLCLEMEAMVRDEKALRKEFCAQLSAKLGVEIKPDFKLSKISSLQDLLQKAIEGKKWEGKIPDELNKLWNQFAPKIALLERKIEATDNLINSVVEKMYGIRGGIKTE